MCTPDHHSHIEHLIPDLFPSLLFVLFQLLAVALPGIFTGGWGFGRVRPVFVHGAHNKKKKKEGNI